MRFKQFVLLIILGCLCIGGPLSVPVARAQNPSEQIIIESNESGVSIIWNPPEYSLATLKVEDKLYSQVQVSGTTLSGQPGYPQLPLYSNLVGLPPSGEATLRIIEVKREVVQLPHPVLPVPVSQPVHFSSNIAKTLPTGSPTTRTPDPTIYQTNALYPDTVAKLGPPEQLRNQRIARLTINPVRFNPVTEQIEVVRYLRLEIIFEHPAASTDRLGAQIESHPFSQVLNSMLVNPGATQWATPQPSAATENSLNTHSGNNLAKIIVPDAGLYALTYNDLLEANLPVDTLDPRTLQLGYGQPRREIAILVEGEADGVFDSADRLIFYAEPEFSRFTENGVYFLGYGQQNGLRMGSKSATPDELTPGTAWHTTMAEVNRHYDSRYPGRDGDHWYWDELSSIGQTLGQYSLHLEQPATTGPDAVLSLWMQGFTDPPQNPDHRVTVTVNGAFVGATEWNDDQAIEANFTVPLSNLNAGANQITLSLPGLTGVFVEGTWIDALALSYPIDQGNDAQFTFQGESGQNRYSLTGWDGQSLDVYEVTNPNIPYRLTNYTQTGSTLTLGDAAATPAKYLVAPHNQIKRAQKIESAQTLTDPPGGADYIIITHPDFAEATAPLAAHRAAQGLNVATIDVNAIYDTFGAGHVDPTAIKTFLQHAYTNWPQPAPTYVLLVGDGSYDFKNHSGYNPQNFIPPYLAHVDPLWGETASDNQLVTLAGNDALPEMLIGRLSVNSATETATVVDKIIHYESTPVPGNWNARHLFVSDKPDLSVGNFYADSDQGYNQVAAPFTGHRFYYGDDADGKSYIYTDAETLRATFLNNFNQGAGIITFHGHGSWLQWADERKEEAILRYYPAPPYPDSYPDDLAPLQNYYRLPVVLEMTCFTASFHRPEYTTLDESLLNLEGGGAVAVWGSTGLGVATGHVSLQDGFYEAINTQQGINSGEATLAGKMNLYAIGFHQDLLDTFMLFGDPALTINTTITPFSHHAYLPVIQR